MSDYIVITNILHWQGRVVIRTQPRGLVAEAEVEVPKSIATLRNFMSKRQRRTSTIRQSVQAPRLAAGKRRVVSGNRGVTEILKPANILLTRHETASIYLGQYTGVGFVEH